MNKNISCDVIQDILPLYQDGICSKASSTLVEEHIKDCQKCGNTLKLLGENEIDTAIRNETQDVIKNHKRRQLRVSLIIGVTIAAFLLLPIIISLLTSPANIQDNLMLSAAMILVAGMTVVPLVAKKNKFSMAVITTTVAMILLVALDISFSDAFPWVLPKIKEILTTSFAMLFALSLFFAIPVTFQLAPKSMRDKKGLIVMTWDSSLFLVFIILESMSATEFEMAGIIGTAGTIIYAWVVFLIIRYTKLHPLYKASLSSVATGIAAIIGSATGFITLQNDAVNLPVGVLIFCLILAAIFAVIGLISSKIKAQKKN